MRPDSDEHYCLQWCGRMRWACVRNAPGRDCNWVLARRLGRKVPGRAGSWGGYQQEVDDKSLDMNVFEKLVEGKHTEIVSNDDGDSKSINDTNTLSYSEQNDMTDIIIIMMNWLTHSVI
jgi:hypothetical protein